MHLIQQHIFDIQCSSQEFGKELHNQLSLLLEKEFYPKLEILFNKYDSKKHIVAIEALAIELPTISKKYWKEELVQKSLIQIEDYLKQNQLSDTFEKEEIKNNFISNSYHAEYLFFEFLKTGKIIENSLSKDLEKLIYAIELTENFIKELQFHFEKDSIFIIRWIFSIPNFFKELVQKRLDYFPFEFATFLTTFFENRSFQNEEIKKTIKKINENTILKKQWIEFAMWIRYLENKRVSKENLLKDFVQLSEDFFEIKKQELHLVCQFILESNFKASEIISKHATLFFEHVKSKISQLNTTNTTSENKFKNIQNSFQEEIGSLNKEINIGNSYYINNAGLIILHPFLKALFEQLELCNKEGIWTKKTNQHKAVLLTQYLIDSEQIIQETDLILNKILCGFSIDEVVNVKLKITKKEKEKCNKLLEAVREYWKPMSTSSIEALQQTFLQREAKLELVKDSEYELWIDDKGVDILLEQLPWGISMIQTPWMENYLNCHWS